MLNLQLTTIALLCVVSALVGYIIGHFIGWYQTKEQSVKIKDNQNPVNVQVHNNVYCNEKKKEDSPVEIIYD